MFKMFKNELNRLIKMPLTLILGILVLGLTLLSSIFFTPTISTQFDPIWENKTSKEIYSTFMLDENHKKYYDELINEAQAILNYYSTLNGRSSEASSSLNKAFSAYNALKTEIPNGDSPTLDEKFIAFRNTLAEFRQTLLNFTSIEDITYIKFIVESEEYEQSLSKLSTLIDRCDYYHTAFTDKAEAANALVNYYTENNYQYHLENISLSAMAFLDITINGLVENVTNAYNKYITYIETIPNTSTFAGSAYEGAENHRLNLKNLLHGSNSFSKLLEYMVDSPYLSVYSNKNLVTALQEDLNDAYTAINLNENNRKYYTSHRNAVMLLKNIDLVTSLNNFQKDYILILPSNEVVLSLSELLNNKVVENRIELLDKINSSQNSSSTSEIIGYIENYKSLSIMSYNLVIYESVLDTSNSLSLSDQSNFYGRNLENYNEYEFKSLSTLYRYYIENEEYPYSYPSALEFNVATGQEQSKGSELIVYMLRIATILTTFALIILSVLLLPYEWQTRTLRLTLARPISRISILFGKLFAIFTIGIIYLFLSFILSLIYVSIIGLSISTASIVTVFNASTILKISPFINLLIIFISHIFELLFITSMIVMISTIFKKVSLATIFNFIAVVAIYLLNLVTNSSLLCAFLPNTNMNFYKYFIAASNADLANILTKVFTTPVCLNMNFILSLLIYSAYLLIFYLISSAVMKCRDF